MRAWLPGSERRFGRPQLGDVLFVDGHAAFAKGCGPLAALSIHAEDAIADHSKTSRRNEAHYSVPMTRVKTGFDMVVCYFDGGCLKPMNNDFTLDPEVA